jgi:hypothetical protein
MSERATLNFKCEQVECGRDCLALSCTYSNGGPVFAGASIHDDGQARVSYPQRNGHRHVVGSNSQFSLQIR